MNAGQGARLDYDRHLGSAAWRDSPARLEEMRLSGHRCRVCDRGPPEVRLEVHHRTYERFGAERVEDLTTLCRHPRAGATRRTMPADRARLGRGERDPFSDLNHDVEDPKGFLRKIVRIRLRSFRTPLARWPHDLRPQAATFDVTAPSQGVDRVTLDASRALTRVGSERAGCRAADAGSARDRRPCT